MVRFAVRVTPPDRSERVNLYLPKPLIGRIDAQAALMGMSRSSYFGWALSRTLGARALFEARLKGRSPDPNFAMRRDCARRHPRARQGG